MAVWRSGIALVSINKVNLRWARSVLGWVTVSGFDSRRRHFISICSQLPRSTQLSTLHGTVKWVPAKWWRCSAAERVTTGVAESNGNLPPGGWPRVICGLTACTPGSAPSPMLGNKYGKPLSLPLSHNAALIAWWSVKSFQNNKSSEWRTDGWSAMKKPMKLTNRQQILSQYEFL